MKTRYAKTKRTSQQIRNAQRIGKQRKQIIINKIATLPGIKK